LLFAKFLANAENSKNAQNLLPCYFLKSQLILTIEHALESIHLGHQANAN